MQNSHDIIPAKAGMTGFCKYRWSTMKSDFSLIQAVIVIAAIGLLYFTLQRIPQNPPLPEIPYTEFKKLLNEGEISNIIPVNK